MKRIFYLCLLCTLVGCQTNAARPPDLKNTVDVTIISFPQGAVIEIDGEYKGRTPNIVALEEYHMERERYAQYYKVFIYPSQEEGYCTQKEALNPYDIPDQLTFDLTQCHSEDEDSEPPVLPNGNLGIHPDTMSL